MNKTFLMTGYSSGIGAKITENLLTLGHTVIGLGRRPPTIEHARLHTIRVDLAALERFPDYLSQLKPYLAHLDGAIFSAGQGRFGHLEQFSPQQIRQLMDVNFTSQAILTRALLPALKQKAHGILLYIGSEAALAGRRQGTVYCASKFALRGFCQALREECASSGIRVCLINPGMVQTPFFDNLHFAPGEQPGQRLTSEDVANWVSAMLTSPEHLVVDELNLSPIKQQVVFKHKT
ncbi:MAG: SDR family NAD(P)-dependent oxidoreductase [Methylococcales bacterium]|nr:SDR family NAD(P)-dependent oxidoreductase [Methylococcales bacterium]